MNITKGAAFAVCVAAVMVVFMSLFALAVKIGDAAVIPAAAILTALVTVTTAYMGIQMANNGVKGHNWNQEMFDSENKQEGKES